MYLGRRIGTSLRRYKQVSNETPNDVSVVCRQNVSLVCLHHVIEECRNDVLRKRNYDVTLAHPNHVSNKS